MMKNPLIDFSFRNICFYDFLNQSLENYNSVLNDHPNEAPKVQQKLFREVNDNNLLYYKEEEKVANNLSEKVYSQKFERIYEFAKKYKIKLSKNINPDEINSFIDDTLYPKLKNKLTSLKAERNPILNLLFPQMINNLLESFDLLNKIKFNLFLNLKMESKKFSDLIVKSGENENLLKLKINEYKKKLNQNNNQLEKEKAAFLAKINVMEAELKEMKDKYVYNEKTLEKNDSFQKGSYEDIVDLNTSLLVVNEAYASDIMSLNKQNQNLENNLKKYKEELQKEKNERINFMNKIQKDLESEKEKTNKLQKDLESEKDKTNKLQKDLESEKEKTNKLQKDLESEKKERIKLKKEYENDKILAEKKGKDFIAYLINNNNEVLKKSYEAFNLERKDK